MRVSINSKNWVQHLESKMPTEFEQNLLLVKTKKYLQADAYLHRNTAASKKKTIYRHIFTRPVYGRKYIVSLYQILILKFSSDPISDCLSHGLKLKS